MVVGTEELSRASLGIGGSLVTRPEILTRAGYHTAGFVANPNLHAPGWSGEFGTYAAPWFEGTHSLAYFLNRFVRGESERWQDGDTTEIVLTRFTVVEGSGKDSSAGRLVDAEGAA